MLSEVIMAGKTSLPVYAVIPVYAVRHCIAAEQARTKPRACRKYMLLYAVHVYLPHLKQAKQVPFSPPPQLQPVS